MKNKAFSLAEILIAVGMIGVISAMTMPSLMKASQHASIGAQLAKVQNAVEEAAVRVQLEYAEEPLKNLEDFESKLQEHLLITGGKLKDGVVVTFSDGTGSVPAAAGTAFKDVNVDLNGDIGPNTAGIDKFWFTMSTQGLMFPQKCAAVLQENNWKVPKDYDNTACD